MAKCVRVAVAANMESYIVRVQHGTQVPSAWYSHVETSLWAELCAPCVRAELGIAEFSLSQTTLEQVFLRVAKADREAEEGPPN